ncbi:MAG TPA: tetratricopeptide repeat protein [Candidatus Saccharimonadales bacterium]|nr:tetratricopeptide repeat protein [Candidatus Saccharimonadales bacterium]
MTTSISRSLAAISASIGLAVLLLFAKATQANQQTVSSSSVGATVLNLIQSQKYNEAITQLEQILEREPGNSDALTYMATANLYWSRNFFKAQTDFKEAFKAGGGATFFVTHSHEMFTTSDVVDYCRGWLHLRKNTVEFSPTDGSHGFKLQVDQITEFAINKLSKKAFHIKAGGKSQNFRGRSNTDLEPILIVALFKNFKST